MKTIKVNVEQALLDSINQEWVKNYDDRSEWMRDALRDKLQHNGVESINAELKEKLERKEEQIAVLKRRIEGDGGKKDIRVIDLMITKLYEIENRQRMRRQRVTREVADSKEEQDLVSELIGVLKQERLGV